MDGFARTDEVDPWEATAEQWAAWPLEVVRQGALQGVPLAVEELVRRPMG